MSALVSQQKGTYFLLLFCSFFSGNQSSWISGGSDFVSKPGLYRISGFEINKAKSEAWWLGSKKQQRNLKKKKKKLFGRRWRKFLEFIFVAIKCVSCVEKNWTERIQATTDLFLHGKNNCKQTSQPKYCWKDMHHEFFYISQFVYTMKALVIPDHVLTQFNRPLLRFLWLDR